MDWCKINSNTDCKKLLPTQQSELLRWVCNLWKYQGYKFFEHNFLVHILMILYVSMLEFVWYEKKISKFLPWTRQPQDHK
jgi:hypothetical protein